MRCSIVVLGLVAVLLAVPLSSSAATVVNMSNIHLSVEIPTGWTYERNSSSGGVTYDLMIEGPAGTIVPPIGLLDQSSWQGSVSDSMLWAEMKRELDGLNEDPEYANVEVVSEATNKTINGVNCNDMTLDADYEGLTLRMRLVILASDEWDMGWKMIIACMGTDWSSYTTQINAMFNSLTVAEKPGTDSSAMLLAVGIVIVAAIVVAVALLVMRGRRKAEPYVPGAPPIGPPMPPPPPPSPPANP